MKKFDSSPAQNPVRAHVYKEIRTAIFDGDFLPGTNLTELRLSSELGVSRTPVREALMQLEMEGLVRTAPGKGVVVLGVSDQDIDDIFTIRMRIEGLAARRAAQNITAEELRALKEIVELQEFYVSRADNAQVWPLNTRFHEVIYEASGSRPLYQMLSTFHSYIQKIREVTTREGRAGASTQEHRLIYNALAAHNPDEAEQAMCMHTKNARDHFFRNRKTTPEQG